MKIVKTLAVAAASVIAANAGPAPIPRTYYKVTISAEATLQTGYGSTKNAKLNTSDVIAALIDQWERDSIAPIPSTKTSEYDLIACYEGGNDQVMQAATYFLVRSRGQGLRFKSQIPEKVFDTEGGDAVFKRLFTANNSTVKAEVTDSFSVLFLQTETLAIDSSGLADAKVTVKDAVMAASAPVSALGFEPAYLSNVENKFNGHHVVRLADVGGVGSIEAEVKGKFKTETFDDLASAIWGNDL